jgi:hypothetical protein
MTKSHLIDIVSILLIILFVYAAVSKLTEFENFNIQLAKSPLFIGFYRIVAVLIPAIEILIALSLAFPGSRLIGLYASFDLMLIFTLYIVSITRFSEYIPCSCGGVIGKLSWNEHLVFNIIFIFISLAGILLAPEAKKYKIF